jgi:hypothetical protein
MGYRSSDKLNYFLILIYTWIFTAGPEQINASQTGLLHLIVKDDKGNLHELMLENALVVPRLSQNLKVINSSLKLDIRHSFMKIRLEMV